MSDRRCPSCGSGAEGDAKFCWLCGYPLASTAALAPPADPVGAPPISGFVWIGGFVLALLVMLGVAVELALLWPGLLIPYTLMLVPVVAVLARIAYVQRLDFWKDREPEARRGSAVAEGAGSADGEAPSSVSSEIMGEVATAIAIGFGAVLVVIGIVFLLAVAAFIILIAICLGMLAAYQ